MGNGQGRVTKGFSLNGYVWTSGGTTMSSAGGSLHPLHMAWVSTTSEKVGIDFMWVLSRLELLTTQDAVTVSETYQRFEKIKKSEPLYKYAETGDMWVTTASMGYAGQEPDDGSPKKTYKPKIKNKNKKQTTYNTRDKYKPLMRGKSFSKGRR